MALARNDLDGSSKVGVCFFDISTFKCFLGSFDDNSSSSILKSVFT